MRDSSKIIKFAFLKLKLLTIIGARPQIIKAAAISRAIKNHFSNDLEEVIVHTGQHYDHNMSEVFFAELGIPLPKHNLNVGSGNHGIQTAAMIKGIEELLLTEKPNAIILYGDTNSTLAGAIAASKLLVPVVHIEAGLRSFNKAMPEEINRILCDHCSTLLFSPTSTGFQNLILEGFKPNNQAPFSNNNPGIYHCGDVMYDNSLFFSSIAETKTNYFSENKIDRSNYVLATIHRNNNTDEPERLNALFASLKKIREHKSIEIVLPLHPRTNKMLADHLDRSLYNEIVQDNGFHILPPASFLEMVLLEKNTKLVMTDSGGVQKEAFFFQKPSVIFRPETEWVELVDAGCAKIGDANEDVIFEASKAYLENPPTDFPEFFGNGKAAEFICGEIIKHIY